MFLMVNGKAEPTEGLVTPDQTKLLLDMARADFGLVSALFAARGVNILVVDGGETFILGANQPKSDGFRPSKIVLSDNHFPKYDNRQEARHLVPVVVQQKPRIIRCDADIKKYEDEILLARRLAKRQGSKR